jgi:hypothetical protein
MGIYVLYAHWRVLMPYHGAWRNGKRTQGLLSMSEWTYRE